MITKMLGWFVIAVLMVCGVWWYLDPVGFSQNPVMAWLRERSLRSSGYHR
jgi:hypothetical protein